MKVLDPGAAANRTIVSVITRTAEWIEAWLEAHRRLYLGLCAVLCCMTFNGYSHAKAPWIDEIYQLTVVRLGSLQAIWEAVKHINWEPPVLSILQHFLIRTFGESMFLMRLPAVVGFTTGCVTLAYLAWRYVPATFAAAVFFMPYATGIRWRAMDARPYGMMFGCAALTLLCWDRMGRQGPRRNAWRLGFVLSLAALNCTHFYAILVLLPLALGELARWLQNRRIDWVTILCVVAGSSVYALWLPNLISISREFMAGYPFRVTFENLYTFYDSAMFNLPFAVLLLLVLAAMALRRAPVLPVALDSPDLSALAFACAGFLLIPVAGFLAGLLFSGVFVPYQFVVAVVGIAVGFPLVLGAVGCNDRILGLALLLAIGGHGLFVSARGLSGYLRRERPYPALAELRRSIPEPHPDIVIPSPLEFLPFQEATRADPENNLVYLYDAAKAFRMLNVDTPERIASHLRGITTARLEPFDDYTARHHRFYIALTGDSTGVWVSTYLSHNMAARFAWVATVGRFDLYQVELPDSSRIP